MFHVGIVRDRKVKYFRYEKYIYVINDTPSEMTLLIIIIYPDKKNNKFSNFQQHVAHGIQVRLVSTL